MEVALRPIGLSDLVPLFNLRNDPTVYRWSRHAYPVTEIAHLEWALLEMQRTDFPTEWVIELVHDHFPPKELIGRIALRRCQLPWWQNDQSSVGILTISLIRQWRHQGLGTQALGLFERKAKKQCSLLMAEIHRKNIASQKLFMKCGYQDSGGQNPWRIFTKGGL